MNKMQTGFYISIIGGICFTVLLVFLIVLSNRPISNVLKLVRSFPEGVDNDKAQNILSILKLQISSTMNHPYGEHLDQGSKL
jgi:Na+-transporting methylmalonyl-CoA/oxaloacetate decarboxylase gamma subunit